MRNTPGKTVVMYLYGSTPSKLRMDNGTQFACYEFSTFAHKWTFNHVTLDQHYPACSGKAESAVPTTNVLFKKVLQDK